MKKPSLYNVCNCYTFFLENTDLTCKDLSEMILNTKQSAFLISEDDDLPFTEKNITVILFNTFTRRAYDLYHDLRGEAIRTVDPVCVQSLLVGVGNTSGKSPVVYKLNVNDIYKKGEN